MEEESWNLQKHRTMGWQLEPELHQQVRTSIPTRRSKEPVAARTVAAVVLVVAVATVEPSLAVGQPVVGQPVVVTSLATQTVAVVAVAELELELSVPVRRQERSEQEPLGLFP